MSITDRVYLKDHRRIGAQLGRSIPKGAFSGAALDLLFGGGADLADLDGAIQDRVLAFAEDFLDCDCRSNPYCGHPERKFVDYLLALRAGGLSPEAMVDAMTDDYFVYAYPGDVLSFLDEAVRTLEASEAIARVEGDDDAAERIAAARRELTG